MSRCWRIRVRRLLEELGLSNVNGLSRIVVAVVGSGAVNGCSTESAGGHRAYIKCCADTRNDLVERFAEVVRLVLNLAQGYV